MIVSVVLFAKVRSDAQFFPGGFPPRLDAGLFILGPVNNHPSTP